MERAGTSTGRTPLRRRRRSHEDKHNDYISGDNNNNNAAVPNAAAAVASNKHPFTLTPVLATGTRSEATVSAIPTPIPTPTPTVASTECVEKGEPSSASLSPSHSSAGDRDGGAARWASDVDTEWLSRETKGYSGADLTSLVRNAAMAALREQDERFCYPSGGGGGSGNVDGRSLSQLLLARRHFEAALETTRPSSGAEAIAKHEGWARQWHVA